MEGGREEEEGWKPARVSKTEARVWEVGVRARQTASIGFEPGSGGGRVGRDENVPAASAGRLDVR